MTTIIRKTTGEYITPIKENGTEGAKDSCLAILTEHKYEFGTHTYKHHLVDVQDESKRILLRERTYDSMDGKVNLEEARDMAGELIPFVKNWVA